MNPRVMIWRKENFELLQESQINWVWRASWPQTAELNQCLRRLWNKVSFHTIWMALGLRMILMKEMEKGKAHLEEAVQMRWSMIRRTNLLLHSHFLLSQLGRDQSQCQNESEDPCNDSYMAICTLIDNDITTTPSPHNHHTTTTPPPHHHTTTPPWYVVISIKSVALFPDIKTSGRTCWVPAWTRCRRPQAYLLWI